jgi:tRNA dimethylallyltransferase
MDELRELYDFKHKKESDGQALDMSKGIWQSIGYRQFEPYLSAIDEKREVSELEKIKSAALEEMKAATRRYAVYQTRWIRLKQIPRLREVGPEAMNNMYLLDSTDVSAYGQNVVEPAVRLAQQFLQGEERPAPTEISSLAHEVLTQVGNPPPKATPCKRVCEICHTVLLTEEAWAQHLKSATHRRIVRKKARTSLVPVEQKQKTVNKADEPDSGPELGSMFSE